MQSLVNEKLTEAFRKLLSTGASTRGNKFDETAVDVLYNHLKPLGFVRVSSKEWAKNYPAHKKRTYQKNFDFRDLQAEYKKVGKKAPTGLIVTQPNGSQAWPDIAIIHNHVGLPIEVKSCGQDVVVWNSGLPRDNSLYLFNCYDHLATTTFLGQAAIDPGERTFLLQTAELARAHNVKSGERWSYFVRDMFNSSHRFFDDLRLTRAIDKLRAKVPMDTTSGTNQQQYDALQAQIHELEKERIEHFATRLSTEAAVLSFLQTFDWSEPPQTAWAD